MTDDGECYNYYTADVTLTDVNGNTASFDLYDLNGPTTALYGDQTYQLVAVWEDVSFDANFKDVGIGTHYDASNGATQLTGLTFEWQGLGEKVGSDEVDMLTGSNGSNTFQAYGGDDVLNGAGGGDTYQFMELLVMTRCLTLEILEQIFYRLEPALKMYG